MVSRFISFWHASYRGEKTIIFPNSRLPGGSSSGLCRHWSPSLRPGPSASGMPRLVWHIAYRGDINSILGCQVDKVLVLVVIEVHIASRFISFWHASYRGEKAIINSNSRHLYELTAGPCRRWSPSLRPGPSASDTPPVGEKRQLFIRILVDPVYQFLVFVHVEVHHGVQVHQLLACLL